MSEGSPTESFGPYLVYEQLGVGGMAQVHRAIGTTSEFQRPVALKRMLSHVADNEDMVRSFVREARLASYLRHENVAQTYDLGKVGDIYFIVMELVTGRNLREVLRHCGATTGPMPVQVALNILNQVCDALDYAHNLCDDTGQPLGIIHRDVSPSNVIVSDSGVVKLIDFGIAKASGAGMQTLGGTLKGKFGYMAPEYIAGRIDARADLFAVGVIAHELLTNRPLFSGRDDLDTLTRVRDMPIDPPSKQNPLVPPEIDDIVMTALQRDPDRRWQHATALRSALTTLTRRLGLIATNTQVIQWFDWAFAQPARARRDRDADIEIDTDSGAASDEPSISIEQLTVQLSALSLELAQPAEDRPAPRRAPSDARPAYVPVQRTPSHAERGPLAPRTTANGVAPAPSAPAHRTRPASVAPPVAAYRPHSHPSSTPPPMSAPIPLSSSPLPVIASAPSAPSSPFRAPVAPSGQTAPLAPPHRGSTGVASIATAPPSDPRSAQVQREFAQRVVTSAPEAVTSAGTSSVTIVILVILAAAVAAAAVYFVVPLLT